MCAGKIIKMFCHSCGKETKRLGLCIDCFLSENPIKLKELEIAFCQCGRFFYGPQTLKDFDKYVKKIVKENLVHSKEIEIKDIEVEHKDLDKKITLSIQIKGACHGEPFEREITGSIKKLSRTCSFCGRISASYYEAVVQFRVPVNARKVLDGEYVTRTEKVPGGFDAYVTSAAYAKKLGKDFARKGCIVKSSSKLIGKKEGRDLYRIFIAILSPGPEVGDVIRYKDKIVRILESGKNVRTKDLTTGKTLMVPPKHLRDSEILAKKEEARKAMVSSVSPKGIQLIDSENYKTIEVPGRFDLKEKDEVEYIEIGKKIFLL